MVYRPRSRFNNAFGRHYHSRGIRSAAIPWSVFTPRNRLVLIRWSISTPRNRLCSIPLCCWMQEIAWSETQPIGKIPQRNGIYIPTDWQVLVESSLSYHTSTHFCIVISSLIRLFCFLFCLFFNYFVIILFLLFIFF